MSEPDRMVDGAARPTAARVAAWIGPRNAERWAALTEFIDTTYPGVFQPEWLFAGKKHGWALRFKKSKSFCSLVPERGRLGILIVFGRAEQEQMASVLPALASHVRDDYVASRTYADGRWLFTAVDSAKALEDVKRLLVLKRRPRPAAR